MEIRNGVRFVTAVSTVICCLSFFTTVVQCLSQAHSSSLKPVIYLNLSSWENRTNHPRFILFRDQLRRQLDNQKEARSSSGNADREVAFYSSIDKNDSAIISEESLKLKLKTESGEGDEETANNRIPLTSATSNNANHDTITKEDKDSNDPKHVISFPKDKTNPYNRLQIQKDQINNGTMEEEQTLSVSKRNNGTMSGGDSGEDLGESLELGNRGEFFGKPAQNSEQAPVSEFRLKDAVPTFELALKVVKLSEWGDENAVFSPLSIANVLSILLLGAEGQTLHELAKQLDKHEHLVTSDSNGTFSSRRYHEAFSELLKYLKSSSGKEIALSIASQVFVDNKFPVESRFKGELSTYYEAPLESIDFGRDGHIFQDRVNRWVQEKTHNKIKSIMDEPPSPLTTMGIINAIYFKGPWEIPFSEKLTRRKDFHVNSAKTVKVEMMVNIFEVPFIERESFRMVGIPYKQNQTGFFVVLPKGNDGVNDLKYVESILTRKILNESISQMKTTKVALSLPKLKFSSDGRMHEILEKMGLSAMFQPDRANFSGISNQGLHISSLLHRAIVEVNEKGTTAAGVSIGTGDRIIDEFPVPFACDKPFIFFIYHIKADTVLFWGRVTQPDLPTV